MTAPPPSAPLDNGEVESCWWLVEKLPHQTVAAAAKATGRATIHTLSACAWCSPARLLAGRGPESGQLLPLPLPFAGPLHTQTPPTPHLLKRPTVPTLETSCPPPHHTHTHARTHTHTCTSIPGSWLIVGLGLPWVPQWPGRYCTLLLGPVWCTCAHGLQGDNPLG